MKPVLCCRGCRQLVQVLVVLLCFVFLYYTLSSLPCSNTPGPNSTQVSVSNPTVVLIWNWPFRHDFKSISCSMLLDIEGCRLTDNRSEYDMVNAVMFHHRDIYRNVTTLRQMPRPQLQKWVWMNMESPHNSEKSDGLDDLFNLTASYRRDSDIWIPYGRIVEATGQDLDFKVPLKDKLVCWIVNNWNERFERVQYFRELRKHVWVETYGGYFNRPLTLKDYYEILSSCKFYLSFENSIHADYITEKLFNPMKCGTVPVVLGPPRDNYEEFVPPGSFIHVDDFDSAQELAEHLKFLDQHPEIYERFFTWRKHFVAESTIFALEQACRVCEHIRTHKGYRVSKNLSRWYWGSA